MKDAAQFPQQLVGKSLVLIGFTLFAMFFGAGNLIFPPFMAAQAGANAWFAMIGFALSAIGFPLLGVIAVAKAGGLKALAGRVHPAFAAVFTLLIYLSIGPCLAIPRTASTSFEMAVTPFLSPGTPIGGLQLGYSVVFFGVALCLALRPEKLTDRLGKILCPCLILLITAIFIGCVVRPLGSYGPATGAYLANPVSQGFLDGYLTMDTIAALNFGMIIAMNIKARGVTESRAVVRGTIRASWIAGGLMLLIYGMLAHIGGVSGGRFPGAANGAQVLTRLVSALFGPGGSLLLAAIFVVACLNTCVGLLSCCSEYFNSLLPRISYRVWVIFFAAVSMVVSNVGLNQILALSVPVLNALYPVAIVLILLSFVHRWVGELPLVYPVTILFTGIASVLYALDGVMPLFPALHRALGCVPLAAIGLGWVLPGAAGLLLGIFSSLARRRGRT